jgi:hypothetical protein
MSQKLKKALYLIKTRGYLGCHANHCLHIRTKPPSPIKTYIRVKFTLGRPEVCLRQCRPTAQKLPKMWPNPSFVEFYLSFEKKLSKFKKKSHKFKNSPIGRKFPKYCHSVWMQQQSGLPDVSWHNIPKCGCFNELPKHRYTKLPWNKTNGHKLYQMVIKDIKIFRSKGFQNMYTKTGSLVWKQTMWLPCSMAGSGSGRAQVGLRLYTAGSGFCGPGLAWWAGSRSGLPA